MAYLAKSTVLHAYKLLSGIDSEKQQGLTQKVSALKYAAALDLFYKNHGQNCDLKQSANRDEFASYVGEIVKINEEYCTKDFFLSISQNGRDFDWRLSKKFWQPFFVYVGKKLYLAGK